MFRFIYPETETSVFDVVIQATPLAAAFAEFRDLWWDDRWDGSLAVFERERLVARVVPVMDAETGRNDPVLEPWPGEVARARSFACGD